MAFAWALAFAWLCFWLDAGFGSASLELWRHFSVSFVLAASWVRLCFGSAFFLAVSLAVVLAVAWLRLWLPLRLRHGLHLILGFSLGLALVWLWL